MQERQVTIGDTSYPLPEPFLVLATQNPIEQEGTYPLPEAQVDRFMLKLVVGYPSKQEEQQIIRQNTQGLTVPPIRPVASTQEIMTAREPFGRYMWMRKWKIIYWILSLPPDTRINIS